MKFTPANEACEICSVPATVELYDSLTGIDHLYCPAHKPDLWPGRNPHLKMRRYRNEPGSATSKLMMAAQESPEHQSFRTEMCDLRILGREGACRYYLSKLTGSDQFALWHDEFIDNVREYVVAETNGAAACVSFAANTIDCMAAFLKHAFELSESSVNFKQSKQERAVVVLLHHPLWSDEQIAKEVPTTTKQLRRNSDYVALRAAVTINSAH